MSLKTLDANISFDDIRARLQFTAVALELAGEDGDKEVAALGAPVGKLLTRWQDLGSQRQQQERLMTRAHALCKRRNMQLDGLLTSLHNATLAAADQDRKAPLFTHLFPKPLSTLLKPTLEGKLKVADAVVERLAKSAAHAALAKAHEQALRDCMAQGEAALEERRTTTATAAELSRRIDVLWADANAALQAVDGALKLLATKRRLGKEWVDSAFPDAKPRATSKKKPAVPAAPTSEKTDPHAAP